MHSIVGLSKLVVVLWCSFKSSEFTLFEVDVVILSFVSTSAAGDEDVDCNCLSSRIGERRPGFSTTATVWMMRCLTLLLLSLLLFDEL